MSVLRLPTSSLRAALFNNVMTGALTTVLDFESRGERPAEQFLELPLRADFPDYYEVIDTPIAISTIQNKIKKQKYYTLREFQEDFHKMVENAGIYNKRSAGIVRDAVALQEVFDKSLDELMQSNGLDLTSELEPGTGKPGPSKSKGIKSETLHDQIQDIVSKLVKYKTADKRQPLDLFMELPSKDEYPDYYEQIKEPIAVNQILEKNGAQGYTTLKELEADLDLMFENAKQYNEEGSQIYNDAEELQKYARTLVQTPSDGVVILPTSPSVEVTEMEVDGQTYKLGDYVYVASTLPDGSKKTVVQIHAINKHEDGQFTFNGLWFFYPEQTVHRASQRFYENEVVKSSRVNPYLSSEILGRCLVLYYKDFVRLRPVGYDPQDVYICELRYAEAGKNLHKIKDWPGTFPKSVKGTEELGIEFAEISPPLKVERTVLIHHPDKESSVPPFGTDDGSQPDDDDDEMDYDAPRGRKHKSDGGERQPKRQRNDTPPALPHAIHVAAPLKARVTPASKALAANVKPQLGTVPWVPTPAIASPIRVAVGRNDRVPADVAAKFETTVDGKLLWFQQPPLDVVPPAQAVHSPKYLEWKMRRREATRTVEQVVEVRPAQPPVKVTPAALATVVEGLAEDWLKQAGDLRRALTPVPVDTSVDTSDPMDVSTR
ncbi:Bromodomain-containing protein [Hyaloraphidium curvatum]|nr:Bromodomain-containing protein [Hyaloraphidium curvatum]